MTSDESIAALPLLPVDAERQVTEQFDKRGFHLVTRRGDVLIVSGDTPKDSFNSNGWPDGTTANYNLLYVRSNGWLTPGWFGQVSPLGKADFSPTTGQQVSPSTPASSASARNGALGGVLHAISRGNAAFVNLSGVGACQGVLAPTAP